MIYPNFLRPTSDGREATENDARVFWQSRLTRGGKAAPLPDLADIGHLAARIRAEAAMAASLYRVLRASEPEDPCA